MRSLIKDLKDEIEALQLEIDSTDENSNCNIEVSDKVFNTKGDGKIIEKIRKMQWCFPGYVSYNDTFVTTVFADSIIPLT
jgi:hypothetical protein